MESDKLEPLSWLDKSYLEKILTDFENEPVLIKDFNKKLATEKCENFASMIHCVNVNYILNSSSESKKISLMTKTKTSDEYVSEIIENLNVFERESHVYEAILQKFEKMLKDNNISTQFGPSYIYVGDGIIVMENLKEKGYGLQVAKKGLNYNQCLAVLNKLAQFHACSMVLYNEDENLFRYHITPTITEEDENPMHLFYINQFETCIEFCKSKPNLEKFVPELEKIQPNLIQRIANIFKKNTNGLNVLNHGDAWVNNFLFKINSTDGLVEDVLMIDFQEGILGSPAIDLLCFMFSSWSEETYSNYKEQLIENYSKTLIETLNTLKYSGNIPTLQDIQKEIDVKKDHGIVNATCLLPVYLNEHPELANPENFMVDTEEAKSIRLKLMDNKNFINRLNLFLSGLFS